MKNYNRSRRLSQPPCDELREGDGIDPRYMQKHHDIKQKRCHQNNRLCKQVEKILSILFSGGCSDDRFDGLSIASVEPEADMSRLLITVIPMYSDPVPDPEGVLQFLEMAKGYLRKEVACEIKRKRMPDFRFKVVVDPEKFIY